MGKVCAGLIAALLVAPLFAMGFAQAAPAASATDKGRADSKTCASTLPVEALSLSCVARDALFPQPGSAGG